MSNNSSKLATEMLLEQVSKLEDENNTLKLRIKELEERLSKKSGIISPEELICIEQINHIKSKNRELTLDEVKRLDLLVKNLRLIRDESTENITSNSGNDFTEEQLNAIALLLAKGE